MILGLVAAVMVIISDQLSKYWILNHVLDISDTINITSFFNIVNAWNTGISFSLFSNSGYWGMIALCSVASIIVLLLLWWLKSEENRLSQTALGLIIGGAVGNIIDRIRLGAVFDFLDFYWNSYHWPAFNVADTFISLGAAVIIIQSIIKKNLKENY